MSDQLDFAKRIYAVQWAVGSLDKLEGSRAQAPSSHVRARSILALLDEAIWQLQAIRADIAPEVEPQPVEAPYAVTNPADPAHAVVIPGPAGMPVTSSDGLRVQAYEALRRLATDDAFREKFNSLSGEEAIALMGLKPSGAEPAPPAKRGRKPKATPEPAASAPATEAPVAAPAEPAPAEPAASAAEPVQRADVAPEPPPEPSVVAPDAERVLQETGDAFRAKVAAESDAHAKAQLDAAQAAASPELAVRPEDVELPWKEGVYANRKLSECTVAELEHIVGQFVRAAINERDAERLPSRKLWVERSKAWHAYRLDEYVTQVALEDRPQLVKHYEAIASMPTSIQPMHAERALWLARVRALSAEGGT